MNYKGYDGSAEFSDEDSVFHGKLMGIRDSVSYESDTVAGLRAAFEEAVDDYYDLCEQTGTEAETPFKGVLSVRLGRELHRKIVICSDRDKKSINTMVKEALERYLAR